MPDTNPEITSTLQENRVFNPPAEFSNNAHVKSMEEYNAMYEKSINDPEEFWSEMASDLGWAKKWNKVLEWNQPFAKWFLGGEINASYNCLDRHLVDKKDKPAIIWEGEPGDSRIITYGELHKQVCQFANVLKKMDVTKGDRVVIYMPMIPEIAIAMLACTRIGATHSVVFGGYSSEALKVRINDAQAELVITADGGFRKGKPVGLKANVDEAIKDCPSVEKVIVVQRTKQEITMKDGMDHWWHELMEQMTDTECEPESMDSEHPMFILYTSGTTGTPKGVVHSNGGYLTQVYTSAKYIFDLKENDIMWCTADVGWITGHSYVVYGPLMNGVTTVMYEGAPTTPNTDRFWEIIDKYKVTIFYTAPTAIRMFMKLGDQWPAKHKMDTLRLLGSVGEPINPEAWMWYYQNIGHEKCPVVDTWWQTETGSILITPLPGATPMKPGSAGKPFFGVQAEIMTKDGKIAEPGQGGFLVIKNPWPSMLRTVYKNPERYQKTYWGEIPNVYFSGDGARKDEDGYFWIMGRVDDIIKVAGHKLGTMEIESALVSHPAVAEAAVVGKPDEVKGESVFAFIVLEQEDEGRATTEEGKTELINELKEHVTKQIGALARPDEIRIVESLPKTRSGKIVRRILKSIASGQEIEGDVSTVEDISVLEKLKG